jgi:hypothetical protein
VNDNITQGARATASPGANHVEIFGSPGLSQSAIFSVPTSSAYVWDGQHRGRRPRVPEWYATLCDSWSRAAWHGEITWEHAARLVELWHPVALEQTRTPGRKRRPDTEQQLELELRAGLLASGVDHETARRLVGLDKDDCEGIERR